MPRLGTNLNRIIARSDQELMKTVQNLPFKVEIKSIYDRGKKVVCWFTIGDHQTLSGPRRLDLKDNKGD